MINRRKLLQSVALTPLAMTVAGEALRSNASGKPAPVTKNTFQANEGSTASRLFPNAEVINADGKKLRFYDDLVKGKIVLITFFYARCEKRCPLQTANLLKVQRLLGDRVGRDIFIYSLTLKPRQDTPEVLRQYKKMYGIERGWELLTGTPQNMESLRAGLGFKDSDPKLDADTGNHIGMVLFGNDALDRWSGCPTLTEAHEMVREISWMDAVIPTNQH
jgi:protein SCO1/2